jgi:hypothetical protein
MGMERTRRKTRRRTRRTGIAHMSRLPW